MNDDTRLAPPFLIGKLMTKSNSFCARNEAMLHSCPLLVLLLKSSNGQSTAWICLTLERIIKTAPRFFNFSGYTRCIQEWKLQHSRTKFSALWCVRSSSWQSTQRQQLLPLFGWSHVIIGVVVNFSVGRIIAPFFQFINYWCELIGVGFVNFEDICIISRAFLVVNISANSQICTSGEWLGNYSVQKKGFS